MPMLVHREQDAPVDGLEPVAGVRQGAGDDHAHGVVEVGAAHLLVDVDAMDRPDVHCAAVVLDIGHRANYIPQTLFFMIATYGLLPFCVAVPKEALVCNRSFKPGRKKKFRRRLLSAVASCAMRQSGWRRFGPSHGSVCPTRK